ncbi:uncharacterized protein LOC121856571, partial [Homarus americanus]|uniref:uncharacterized protein LOC121856571 n=1 Tax=Homarus americanus TaxID=6706 RepID=UPI001C446BEA
MVVYVNNSQQQCPEVTSTGKAGGAGVRAGCVVKGINGTPTAQLSLSHAHALTKQGSTLTLEIDDNSEEPPGACLSSSTSICSSNSASTSSTVIAANGHISSSRRRTPGKSTILLNLFLIT